MKSAWAAFSPAAYCLALVTGLLFGGISMPLYLAAYRVVQGTAVLDGSLLAVALSAFTVGPLGAFAAATLYWQWFVLSSIAGVPIIVAGIHLSKAWKLETHPIASLFGSAIAILLYIPMLWRWNVVELVGRFLQLHETEYMLIASAITGSAFAGPAYLYLVRRYLTATPATGAA